MAQKKNRHLRVVREDSIRPARAEEEDLIQKMKEELQKSRRASRKKIYAALLVVALIIAAIAVFVYMQTYTKVRVTDTYTVGNAFNNSYKEFAKGVLKYSRDGVSYLNEKGVEQWNHPYQIKSPMIDLNREAVAIADRGGNSIMIFKKDGVKGEIETTLPIEKISVSEQGIVAAILKNESSPQIVCYDAAGNILVEHKATLSGTGYPLDIAISGDGEVLQVVYLVSQGTEVRSKVAYYNFGEAGAKVQGHLVTEKEYEKSLLATGFYMDDSVSAVVGDNCITLYKGSQTPKEITTISVKDEIQSVFHSDKYIGIITKKNGKNGHKLSLYNVSGRKVLSKTVEETYKSAKISGSQIILYDGKKCNIYTQRGVQRFKGEMENSILEIFPISGVNKYIVINANGMENIRLVK